MQDGVEYATVLVCAGEAAIVGDGMGRLAALEDGMPFVVVQLRGASLQWRFN